MSYKYSLFLLLTCQLTGPVFGAAARPNILCVTIEDTSVEYIGAYGSPLARTPNIDALASDGILYKYAYTAPVCSVSRNMMITGRFASGMGTQHMRSAFPLPADVRMFPEFPENLIPLLGQLSASPARGGFDYYFARGSRHQLSDFGTPRSLRILQGESADDTGILEPPYLPSQRIAGMKLDWSTHQRHAPGSDNFQLTWAADNNLYGAWGDGGGFGGTNKAGRVGLGFARIEGDADNYRGYNVWGGFDAENPATFDGKSWGTLALGDDFYMWVVPDIVPGKEYRNHYEYIELARSSDRGATWNKAGWKFLQSEGLSIPTFLNFGKAYRDIPESFAGYVYSYFIQPESPDMEHQGPNGVGLIVHKPGRLYLARAKAASFPPQKGDFEFFSGLDPSGQPIWGTLEQKASVFEDVNGVGWCLSACYHPGLQRVLLATEHGQSHTGQLGIFDAPTPWGPWSTVIYQPIEAPFGAEREGSDLPWANNVFFVAFPTKWFDGLEFTLNFTGSGNGQNNDSFNTVRGRFQLHPSNKRP